MPHAKASLADALWPRVDQSGDCWEWQGFRRNGYGRFCHRGTNWAAHRAAFALTHGPIPVGSMVLHHCDNPPCCNPAHHLFLGDQTANMRDMAAKGRGRPMAGIANPRAKLTPAQVIEIRRRAADEQHKALAAEFGVTATLIGMIVKRRVWRSLDEDFVGQFPEGRSA